MASTLTVVAVAASASPAAAATGGFTSVSAGAEHSCAVTADGAVYCWGSADSGRLGGDNENSGQQLSPGLVDTPAGVTWAAVTAGWEHSCAVTTDGAAYCWGSNESGQVGQDPIQRKRTFALPVLVDAPAGVTWASISAGAAHSCAVTTDGAVYCWGDSGYGQLGGPRTSSSLLVLVDTPPGSAWATVAAGVEHSCAVTTDGLAYCWGQDAGGKLGSQTDTGAPQGSPLPVVTPAGVTWRAVTAGSDHSCGVTTEGAAYCWGTGDHGQLGGSAASADAPVPVETPAGVLWAALDAGSDHTCGRTETGESYCWGEDSFGQLGDGAPIGDQGTPSLVMSPLGVVWASVAAGGAHSCGVTTGGDGHCWGLDWRGQVGNGFTSGIQPAPSPLFISFGPEQTIEFPPVPNVTMPAAPFGLAAAVDSGLPLSFAASGTCSVAGATVTVTGVGTCTVVASQAGNAEFLAAAPVERTFTISNSTQTIDFDPLPAMSLHALPFEPVVSASSGLAVSLAASGTCSVTGPTVTLTGVGSCTIVASQNGNDAWQAAAPVERTFRVGVVDRFVSIAAGYAHSCGVTELGDAYCWGADDGAPLTTGNTGQLGNGAPVGDEHSPTLVDTPAGVRWTAITAGAYHTCALTTTGEAYCWGLDWQGQLGDGAPSGDGVDDRLTGSQQSPSHVATKYGLPLGLPFDSIEAGTLHTCAVASTTRHGYCWGYNGQDGSLLGINVEDGFWDTPTRQLFNTPRFASMAPGRAHSCGLSTSGTAYCWGSNGSRQLGSPGGHALYPREVEWDGGRFPLVSIAAGQGKTCAVTPEAELVCWGIGFDIPTSGGAGITYKTMDTPDGVAWASVSFGRLAQQFCALSTAQDAYCWGDDDYGSLGNGATTGDQDQPGPVDAPPGIGWSELQIGGRHTCGLTTEGEVYCWGYDAKGQVGNGVGGGTFQSPVRIDLTWEALEQSIVFGSLPDVMFGVAPFELGGSASSGLPVAYSASGSCSVSGSTLTVTGAGSCSVVASQGGDVDWLSAAPVEQSFTVAQGSQSIVFGSLPDVMFGVAPFELGGSASSGLPVAYSASGSCSVSGSTLTVTGAGSCTVVASQGGDVDWLSAAPDEQSFTIERALPSLVATSTGTVVYGGTVAATATVSAASGVTPTGQVTFTFYGPDDPECVTPGFSDTVAVDGTGTATTTFSPDAGTYRGTVSYSGDANHLPVSLTCGAAGQDVTVDRAPTSLFVDPAVLAASGRSRKTTLGLVSARLVDVANGVPVAGETIRFRAGEVTVCTTVTDVDGRATCELGTRDMVAVLKARGITADFDGSQNHTASTGANGVYHPRGHRIVRVPRDVERPQETKASRRIDARSRND